MAKEELPEEEMEMEEAEVAEPALFGEGDEGEGEGEEPLLEVSTVEVSGEAGSLEEGVSGLIEEWSPTTPEGEKYKADLEALLGQFGPGEAEESPEAMEAGDFGFDLGLLGKEAARRAMKPEGL